MSIDARTAPAPAAVADAEPVRHRTVRSRLETTLFTATAFLTAALLFMVQPMVGRMVLPSFGGSPQVWTTSMLFFQVALLAGYGYTHATTQAWGRRYQPRIHIGIALLPLAILPIVVDVVPSGRGGAFPSLELLAGLALGVAAPFILVATSGPLLQRWLSWTDHPSAKDPYFLYAAGNVGSAVGLISYPFLLEPALSVERQSQLWAGGYVLAIALLVACAWRVHRCAAHEPASQITPPPSIEGRTWEPRRTKDPRSTRFASSVSWRRRLRWVLLAFVPSSVMLAATSHLSTDVAAVPMLWVVPLGVYLLTFSVAFGRAGPVWTWAATALAAPVAFAAITVTPNSFGIMSAIGVQVLFVAVAGGLCHGLLAADRPPPSELTRFYFLIAVGGALGGVINSLVAPAIFPTIVEHPLMAATMLALVIRWREPLPLLKGRPTALRWLIGASLAIGLVTVFGVASANLIPGGRLLSLLVFVLLLAPLCLPVVRVGVVGLTVAALALLPAVSQVASASYIDRTFYGVHRVVEDAGSVTLLHGTTVHGMQDLASTESRRLPQSYYHREGPIGDLYGAFGSRGHVGVLGLGSGVLAAYGAEAQTMVFHEIDPSVVEIAETWFTYLADSDADIRVVLGDGRLTIAESGQRYSLLVLDAFTSDAIPIHLLTVEAFASYLETMEPDGVIALHISNRHLDLRPVAAGLADANALHVLERHDAGGDNRPPSRWVAFARDASTLHELETQNWVTIDVEPITWTDQRSDLWSVTVW